MSAPTQRRRDASMTLLTEVMQRPLDPGYAAAAAERAASGNEDAGRRRDRRRAPLTVAVAVVVGVVLTAAIAELRLPGATTDARALLLEEIGTRTATADALAAQVEGLRSEVQDLQAQALSEEGDTVLDVAQRLSLHAGAVPVTGPGVVVTLDDAPQVRDPLAGDPRATDSQDQRVVDLDVQIAVNGLWAVGAEAVAVNGQRLTSLSAIRWAGGAILVGFRPLQPPYEIAAVGDPDAMRTAMADSSAGRYLAFLQERYGLRTSIEPAEALELPGAGALQLRYARASTPPVEDAVDSPEENP